MTAPSGSHTGNDHQALERLNAIYAQIGVATRSDVPEQELDGHKALKGKKILLIDDSAWVFELYAEPLMSVTGGNAYFLLHEGLKLNSLLEKILEIDPQYVLMDANLDSSVSGIDVTAELVRRKPEIRVIGFSNSISYAPAFMEAGAVGAVRKRSDDVGASMKEIEMLIGRFDQGLRAKFKGS